MKSLFPFIIIAICIATYYMYLSPRYDETKLLRAKETAYTEALEKSKELIQKRDALLGAYSQIPPENIDRLKKIIPDSATSVDIVNQINALASPRGLQVKNVLVTPQKSESNAGVVGKPASDSGYTTTNVSSTLIGSYEGFMVFLQDLESSARLSDIYSLTIRPNAKSATGTETFEFVLNFRTYSL